MWCTKPCEGCTRHSAGGRLQQRGSWGLYTRWHQDSYTSTISSQTQVPGFVGADESGLRNEPWWCVHVVKRDELPCSPNVTVEVHVWNRSTGKQRCYLDSLFHWEGGWFSDMNTSSVLPVDLHVHQKRFAVTVSWTSEVVLLYREPWTSSSHSMQHFIFPGTFLWVCLHSSCQLPGSGFTSPFLHQRRC